MGVDQGLIRKSGAWFTYEGEQLGQARRMPATSGGERRRG